MAYQDAVIIISDSPSPPPSPPPPPLDAEPEPDFFDDFYLDDNLDDYLGAGLGDDPYPFPDGEPPPREEPPPMPALRSGAAPGAQNEGLSKCEEAVSGCFPDICPDYLQSQAAKHGWDAQALITHLLDELEKGQSYPKRPNLLKRKRLPEKEKEGEEEEMRRKFEDGDPRLASKGPEYVNLYIKAAKGLLKAAFPQRYAEDIETTLKENKFQIYTTYVALDKAPWGPEAAAIRFKRPSARGARTELDLRNNPHPAHMEALAAFDAARAACAAKTQIRVAKEAEEKRKVQEEEENLRRAKAEGTVADCGCCYEELPLNRMVHCAGDIAHWFCRSCAKQMAEHVVGLSKHRLDCMSVDGCNATFSRDQRALFLDDKLATALELIEQEEALRLAGIENLATCPFCPYAAEYPPVEENKELQCENPDCRVVSCRLCRQETHIPKTCQEAAKERGRSARRTIEEAMTAALIRKCNKCGTPFIKELGCNKMTCTRGGCRNVQCYVCSKSCDYSHFNDPSRGGKQGNCPLFESAEQRHQDEVHAAEELARQQVAEENPGVEEELLKINFSEKVKQDDERRKAADPRPPQPAQPLAVFGAGAARVAGVAGGMGAAGAAFLPQFPPVPWVPDPLVGGIGQLVDQAHAIQQADYQHWQQLVEAQAEQAAEQVRYYMGNLGEAPFPAPPPPAPPILPAPPAAAAPAAPAAPDAPAAPAAPVAPAARVGRVAGVAWAAPAGPALGADPGNLGLYHNPRRPGGYDSPIAARAANARASLAANGPRPAPTIDGRRDLLIDQYLHLPPPPRFAGGIQFGSFGAPGPAAAPQGQGQQAAQPAGQPSQNQRAAGPYAAGDQRLPFPQAYAAMNPGLGFQQMEFPPPAGGGGGA